MDKKEAQNRYKDHCVFGLESRLLPSISGCRQLIEATLADCKAKRTGKPNDRLQEMLDWTYIMTDDVDFISVWSTRIEHKGEFYCAPVRLESFQQVPDRIMQTIGTLRGSTERSIEQKFTEKSLLSLELDIMGLRALESWIGILAKKLRKEWFTEDSRTYLRKEP